MAERQEWLERVSRWRQQEECVVERPQVVEEGLSCPRAGGRGSNSITVGGRGSCRCYGGAVQGSNSIESLVAGRQERLLRVWRNQAGGK